MYKLVCYTAVFSVVTSGEERCVKNSPKLDNVNEMELARVSLIHNDNWTKWSAVCLKIIHVMRKFDFQTKIARHQVQLPLFYSRFEIAEFSQYHYLFDLAAGLLKSGSKKAFNLVL